MADVTFQEAREILEHGAGRVSISQPERDQIILLLQSQQQQIAQGAVYRTALELIWSRVLIPEDNAETVIFMAEQCKQALADTDTASLILDALRAANKYVNGIGCGCADCEKAVYNNMRESLQKLREAGVL